MNWNLLFEIGDFPVGTTGKRDGASEPFARKACVATERKKSHTTKWQVSFLRFCCMALHNHKTVRFESYS
ncbi:hypothetical protein [Asticcacaulis sp. EMRT-3]|uniref:hypothetical protein n=1 Tax=Asticcacaulis sp. EMRT-3 TaxID=3040349 RepID=UPI0024AFDFD0|nr:hypothetical protein [Asticcacaulis sp. EMRT-3]MDI7775885.1 hypothetical protein [Asticcacaulis sp. EMRT-3]